MRRLLLPAAVMLAQLSCGLSDLPWLPVLADPCSEWPEPGLYRMDVGEDWSRNAVVYVPREPGGRDGVVVLHGAGGSPDRMRFDTSFEIDADLLRFVAVFPPGSGGTGGLTWNAGSCCGYAESVDQPDVDFLEATQRALRDQLCVDRVLAAGHSNGAMMTMRWTCEAGSMDAVVANAGPLLLNRCEGEPVPVMAWHGTGDTRVPFAGGATAEGETFPPVAEAFALVRARNRCTDDPPEVTLDGDVRCSTWTCEAPTTLCEVEGWPHVWPGGVTQRTTGPKIEDIALDWFFALETPAPEDTDGGDTDPPDTDPPDTDPQDSDPPDTDP